MNTQDPPQPAAAYRNPLHRLVAERLAETGDSIRNAAAKSGGKISFATLGVYARGEGGRPHADTVLGLARALELPESVVWRAAEETYKPHRIVQLSEKLTKLPPAEQDRIVALLEAAYEEIVAEQRNRKRRERPFG